jgi:hypothetical protein
MSDTMAYLTPMRPDFVMSVELAGKSTTFLHIELTEMLKTDPALWDTDDIILYNLIRYELACRN